MASAIRLARIGVGLLPCSLRARLLGFALHGRGRPSATKSRNFATSDLMISVTSRLPAPGRFEHLLQHRDLVARIGLGQLGQMLGDVAVDHVRDPRGTAPLIPRRQRILPLVDGAAQFLGALARGSDAPLRPIAPMGKLVRDTLLRQLVEDTEQNLTLEKQSNIAK